MTGCCAECHKIFSTSQWVLGRQRSGVADLDENELRQVGVLSGAMDPSMASGRSIHFSVALLKRLTSTKAFQGERDAPSRTFPLQQAVPELARNYPVLSKGAPQCTLPCEY